MMMMMMERQRRRGGRVPVPRTSEADDGGRGRVRHMMGDGVTRGKRSDNDDKTKRIGDGDGEGGVVVVMKGRGDGNEAKGNEREEGRKAGCQVSI